MWRGTPRRRRDRVTAGRRGPQAGPVPGRDGRRAVLRDREDQEGSMKAHVASTLFAVLVGLASLAHAAQLTSNPLSTNQWATNHSLEGVCHIRNVGTTPVTVTVSVFSNNATVPFFDTCQGDGEPRTLAPGQSCSATHFMPDASFGACSVTAASVRNLRGRFEVQQNFNTI